MYKYMVGRDPVCSSTTVSDLRHLAFDRLYSARVSAGEMPPDTTAELFLCNYHLSPKNPTVITLAKLGLQGDQESPLDIFVTPIRAAGSRLHDMWGFTSSDRGVATFL